ncbi:hypothetical protein [Geothrix sp. 21YS21S-2]|uniref:hypothetical protein n=1 Tax=Geothrix sp. 21YS21S-2 TaxID=3068893 RepID=UPI0027BA1EC1|nr:hypothetical protein [Geothrix sp. 21YS21S-2]
MGFASRFMLCTCVLASLSCQPVHVETRSRQDTHPEARTFMVGDDTWVEIKINSSGEASLVSFDAGTPDSLQHSVEDPYDVLRWKIKAGRKGALATPNYVATLTYKQSSKKIEIQLRSQLANALSETMRVIVHLVPL